MLEEEGQRRLERDETVPVPEGTASLQLDSHDLVEVSGLHRLMEQCGYSFFGVGMAQVLVTVLEVRAVLASRRF